jgi:hypothetical protein
VATLNGSSAADYAVAATSGNLTIAQASTLTTLSPSISTPTAGLPVTLNIQAASTTGGVPTGSVTVLDGSTVLSVVPLTSGGAAFTTSALALGAHSLTSVYSGDSNFLPSSSAVASITVLTPSDFTLAPTGTTSQSVPAGSAATFTFAVAIDGAAISSPILLAVQGTPAGATASLSPALLPPGNSAASFTLTIQTPLAATNEGDQLFTPHKSPPQGTALLSFLLLPIIGAMSRRSRRPIVLILLVAASTLASASLIGCADRINTAPETVNAKTYTLTVTGTATSSTGTAIQHSANVTLQVLQ